MENKDDIYEVIDKTIKASLLLDAVLSNDEMDLWEEPCKVNIRKYEGFNKAVEILTNLKEKGQCDFEVADIRKEYMLHTIDVTWKTTDEFYLSIDDTNKTEIKMLLDCVDDCLIPEDKAKSWQLSSKIYVPIREIEGK